MRVIKDAQEEVNRKQDVKVTISPFLLFVIVIRSSFVDFLFVLASKIVW